MSIFATRKKVTAPRAKIIFDAYKFVTPGQYHLYTEYAGLFLGSAQSINLARKILVLAYVENDETVIDLNAQILTLRKNFATLPVDHDVFAIRSRHGNTFDLYYLDSTGKYLSGAGPISEDHFSWSADYLMRRTMEESSKA